MMWRVALAVWLTAVLSLFALNAPRAQFNGCTAGFCSPVTTSAAYVGPGDLISGASMWFGLRGYSAAYAAPGTNPAIKIIRASDSTNTTINILSNGNLDTATAATFCNSTTCTVTTWYDQTGHSCDATQATVANQPTLTFNGIASFPVLTGAGLTTTFADFLTTACTYTQALPVTFVAYAIRNGNAATTTRLIGLTNVGLLAYNNTANNPSAQGKTTSDLVLGLVADGTWQTLIAGLNVNNSPSDLFTNGVSNTNFVSTGSITGSAVGAVNGTYNNVRMSGGHGSGALAQVVVSGGALQTITFAQVSGVSSAGRGYQAGDVLTPNPADVAGMTGATFTISTVGGTFTDGVSFAAALTLFGRNATAQGFNGNMPEIGAWPIMFSQANATALDANIRNYY